MRNETPKFLAATLWLIAASLVAGCASLENKDQDKPPLEGGGKHKITQILLLSKENATLLKEKNPITMKVGERLTLRVMACWAIPSVTDVTGGAKLTVDDPARGDLDSKAVFTARTSGKVTLQATYQGFSDGMELTIVP